MKKPLSFNTKAQIKRLVMGCTVVGVVATIGVIMLGASRAASSSMSLYLSPATGTYSIGNSITLSIRENSGSTGLVGVQANLTYPQAQLQFVSINTSTSAFPTAGPANTGGSGTVAVDMFTATPQTGDQEVADVNFTVLSAGSAQVEFAGSSQVGDSSGNLSTPTLTGGTYTLQTPTCPSGQTGTPPNCVTPSCPSGQTGTPPNCVSPTPTPTPPVSTTPPTSKTPTKTSSSGSSSSTSAGSSAATSYTPSGVTTPATVPNNSSVKVSAPVTVSPVPSATSSPIAKVEYFLNSNLLITIDNAPFTYKLDTTNILNGTYKFTTETFYVNGKTSSVSQQLVIRNKISFNQVRLAAQKYAPPIIIPIILIACVFFLLRSGIFRNIGKKGGGPRTPQITVGGNKTPPVGGGPSLPADLVGETVTNPALQPKVYAPGEVYSPRDPIGDQSHAHL
jgi:hypothetical protein